MRPFRAVARAVAATVLIAPLAALSLGDVAAAQTPPSSLTEKLNAYVGCINRLSERSYESRSTSGVGAHDCKIRYFAI